MLLIYPLCRIHRRIYDKVPDSLALALVVPRDQASGVTPHSKQSAMNFSNHQHRHGNCICTFAFPSNAVALHIGHLEVVL